MCTQDTFINFDTNRFPYIPLLPIKDELSMGKFWTTILNPGDGTLPLSSSVSSEGKFLSNTAFMERGEISVCEDDVAKRWAELPLPDLSLKALANSFRHLEPQFHPPWIHYYSRLYLQRP